MSTRAATAKSLIIIIVVTMLGAGLFVYSGIYPVGADVPHNRLTNWLLETARERSIARAARELQIPDDLNSVDRLLGGGADYNDMCAGCHLKPGRIENDLTLGLYPAPPNLTLARDDLDEVRIGVDGHRGVAIRRQFWIIKHGIKASGMPAWGPGHDNERIWNMVAFLERLPELSPDQYQILTARGQNGP